MKKFLDNPWSGLIIMAILAILTYGTLFLLGC